MDNWLRVYLFNILANFGCMEFAEYYHSRVGPKTDDSVQEHVEMMIMPMFVMLIAYLIRYSMTRSFLFQVAAEN